MRELLRPRLLVGLAIVGSLILIALLAPIIAARDPTDVDTSRILQPPSWLALFGTDDLGRDVFSRVVWGSRVSLAVGAVSVAIGLVVGTTVGLVCGYRGGWTDLLVMRGIDALLAFPGLVLALAITAALGTGIQNVMLAIGVVSIPTYARLARGQTLSIRHREFIVAAHAVGVPPGQLLARHVLPNIVNPLIVAASLTTGFAILAEAGLSFLGLGAQPPTPSWGQDIAYSQQHLLRGFWWTVTAPGVAIFVAILGFNTLGDGLRDYFDPRRRRR